MLNTCIYFQEIIRIYARDKLVRCTSTLPLSYSTVARLHMDVNVLR